MKLDETEVPVGILMSARDFMYLRVNELDYADWDSKPDGRFVPDDDTKRAPKDTWKKAYFFESRTDVILACAFLRGVGAPFERSYDTYEENADGSLRNDCFVILTDYEYDEERK